MAETSAPVAEPEAEIAFVAFEPAPEVVVEPEPTVVEPVSSVESIPDVVEATGGPDVGVATVSGATLTIVDDTVGTTGWYTSLQLDASGNPVISYFNLTNTDLMLAHCNDTKCATKTLETVASTGNTGRRTSLQLDASGYPVISYYDGTNGDLRLAHCNTSTCEAGFEVTVTVSGTGTGTVTSTPVPIVCPGVCTAAFPTGATITFTATPVGDATVTWTGCDSNPTPQTCQVDVTADRSIGVTFTDPIPVTTPTTSVSTTSVSTTSVSTATLLPFTGAGRSTGPGAALIGLLIVVCGLTLVRISRAGTHRLR